MGRTIRIKMNNTDVELDLSLNVLTLSTVRSQFLLDSNALVSLSYEVGGRLKGCQLNESGSTFLLPECWPTSQFYVNSTQLSPSPAQNQDSKGGPINNYYQTMPPIPAPPPEAFIKWMFFLHDKMGKAITICVHPRFFVTFRHGTHLQFKIGDSLKMYSAEREISEQVGIDVCVVKVKEELDFVFLKADYNVVDKGPPIGQARYSEPFTLAGYGNDRNRLSYSTGAIYSYRDFYFKRETFAGASTTKPPPYLVGPLILGMCQNPRDFGEAAVWGSRGLIGWNYSCTTTSLHFQQNPILEKNIICPASRFECAFMKELLKEQINEKMTTRSKKKQCIRTEIDGLGTLHGGLE